jgi:hypothetical protein
MFVDVKNIDNKKLLFFLVSADLIFIVLHVLYIKHVLANPLLSIEMDRGYAEVYQYIKEFWIVLMLLVMAIRTKHLVYIAWSSLFMYFLLDDSLKIHEKLGGYLIQYYEFNPAFNLRTIDYAEICVSILFGTVLFLFIFLSYIISNSVQKTISRNIFILVLLLAFFGVVVDMLHVAIPWWKLKLGIIEDGGEMLSMSIIVWYVFTSINNSKERRTWNFQQCL